MRSSHALHRTEITFDDDHAVANASLVLTATLAERLGLEALVDEMVDRGDRPGAASPGRKVMTLVASMVAGPVVLQVGDEVGEQPGALEFEAQRPANGKVVVEGRAQVVHDALPGHGRAKARNAVRSTFA